jgi:hypothetical protein
VRSAVSRLLGQKSWWLGHPALRFIGHAIVNGITLIHLRLDQQLAFAHMSR